RCLACLQATKERLIGFVETRQYILQDMAMDGRKLWHLCAEGCQLSLLLIARDGDVTSLPRRPALLQCRVVEHATAPQHRLKLALLFWRRFEFVLVGFAQALAHGYLPAWASM